MKYLNNLNRSFATNGAWLSLRYVVVSLLGLLLSISFARWSTPHLYGQFQVVLASMSLFSIFTLPGLNMLAMRSFATNDGNHLKKIVKYSFFGGILAVPFVLLYSLYFLEVTDNRGWVITLMAVCFPFLYAPNCWSTFYEGKSKFGPSTIRFIGLSLIVNSLLIYGVYKGFSLPVILSFYFISNMVLNWIYFFETDRKNRVLSTGTDSPFDLRYGIFVSVQKYIVGMSEYLPSILIASLLGAFAVAQFQIAYVFFGAIAGFIGAISTLYLPLLFKGSSLAHSTALGHAVIMGIFSVFGYYILVSLLFIPLYGESYRASFELAKFFSALPFFAALRIFFVNLYTAKGKNVFVINVHIVANIVSAALFFAFVNKLSFAESISIYIYSFFLSLLVPFLYLHYFPASRKIASI
ncbi:MAG: oligosaccharide flippase family protein [Candidatus Moraniibacteriota bacterium]